MIPLSSTDSIWVGTDLNNVYAVTLFTDLAYIRAMPGLSAGRNAAVRATITPYVMLLDDDYIFTERTNILKLLQVCGSAHIQ